MRLDQAIRLYLDTLKPSTAEAYWKALKTVQEIVGPGRLLDDITPADMVRVHTYIEKKNYAAATMRQRVTSIKVFFNWLHKMELASANPARVLKVKRPKRPQTREKAITDEELKLLLDYAQLASPRDFALFSFLADTGCRIGGAAGLLESHINWEKREATVTEKGENTRQVKFGISTSNILRRWLIMRKATRGTVVFSVDGGPIKPENLSQRVRRTCKKLQKNGIPIRVISAHAFRHRKGHQFADAKINPAIAATALGHESVLTTLEHYYPDDWETAAQALEEFAVKRSLYGRQNS